MELHFEWNRRKALANAAKHGVTFVEAKTVFGDPLAILVDDPRHSREEGRYVAFGRSDWATILLSCSRSVETRSESSALAG